MRDEAQMQEATGNVREAADSARAAAAKWASAVQDQADYATAVEAGGRLPPQEVAVTTEESAGSQAQAAAGYAPWKSAEETAGDIGDMGRILEDDEVEDVSAAVCNLCDGHGGEVTGGCKGGKCDSCCQSSRGPGLFACCSGGYGSSGDESSAEAQEAVGVHQEAEVEQAVDMEQQTGDVENATALQEMHHVIQVTQQDIDRRRERIGQGYYGPQNGQRGGRRQVRPPAAESSRQQETPQATTTTTTTVGRRQQMALQVAVTQHAATQG